MPARRFTVVALALLLLGISSPATAQLRLAPVIGDGMVLQRHATVPVWGSTSPGDTIVVTFDRRTYTAVPDARGQWMIKLPPKSAGGPYEMTVAGKREQLQVRNILVGDVWLCAGQSNMVFTVNRAQNAAQEIAAARDLQIRHFHVPHPYDEKPATEPAAELTGGAWAMADSLHVKSFTAVGYFFARELRNSVDVPIGLINVSVGGSAIGQWMSREARRLVGDSIVEAIYPPNSKTGVRGTTLLYNKLVHPLLPYPIKGVLWYQGEEETLSMYGANFKYRDLFPAMINDWRRAWGHGDLPFLFVQLPNWEPPTNPGWDSLSMPILRESQSMALRLPNTAQVVTLDLGVRPGEKGDALHPPNKQDVGARLALAARKVAYGQKVESSGPQYRRHTIRDGRIILEFDHVDRGLVVGHQGSELHGFAIAGADQQFVSATATIDRNRVVVWSERVPKPVAVRYAWTNNPHHANLYNRADLPAAPFRTDDWSHKLRKD